MSKRPTTIVIHSSHGDIPVNTEGERLDLDDSRRALPEITRILPSGFGLYHGDDDILDCWVRYSGGPWAGPDVDHYAESNGLPWHDA